MKSRASTCVQLSAEPNDQPVTASLSPNDLTIEAVQRRDGAILVLLPRGRIEAPDIEEFENSIHDRIVSGDLNIIIDLANVEAIDSAGIRSLLSITAGLVVKHGKLVLCNLGNNLSALLKVTAFDQIVEIVDSYEDAVESFR